MAGKGGLRRLDDRLLGSTAIAIIAGLLALYLITTGVGALLDEAWIAAPIYIVLGLGCGQAAFREWRRRGK
jgi:hypothetical protein